MSPSVLVIGEALIDEVIDGDTVSRHPGGSPANVALGLARLDVATRLHTAIGNDTDGAFIRRHLTASGVILTPDSVTSSPTSTAIATLARDGSATYQFNLSWDPAPLDDLATPTLIHTGSLAAFLQPGSHITSEAVRQARARDARTSFDPNIRPSLLPDPVTTRRAFEQLASNSGLIKLSDEDADYLYPGMTSDRVLDHLVASGAAIAAITLGSKGACLASADERVEVPALKTRVIDTVGAGDSFMAALIWALVSTPGGWDGAPVATDRLQAIGATAALAAALTVSRPGADLPSAQDIKTSLVTL